MNGPFSKGVFPVLDDLINKLFWNRIFVIIGYNNFFQEEMKFRSRASLVTSARPVYTGLFCGHETDHLAVLATRDQTFLLALKPLSP